MGGGFDTSHDMADPFSHARSPRTDAAAGCKLCLMDVICTAKLMPLATYVKYSPARASPLYRPNSLPNALYFGQLDANFWRGINRHDNGHELLWQRITLDVCVRVVATLMMWR